MNLKDQTVAVVGAGNIGRALIGGHDTEDEYAVKHQIGLVHSDERSFYWRLSARENLPFSQLSSSLFIPVPVVSGVP